MATSDEVTLPPPPAGFTETPPGPPAGFSEVPGGAPGAMPGIGGPQIPDDLAGTAPRTSLDIYDLLAGATPGMQGPPPVIPKEHQKMYESMQELLRRAKIFGVGELGGMGLGAVIGRLAKARQIAESPILELGANPRVVRPARVTSEYAGELSNNVRDLETPIAKLRAEIAEQQGLAGKLGTKEKLPGLENARKVQLQNTQDQIATAQERLAQLMSRSKSLSDLAAEQQASANPALQLLLSQAKHYLPGGVGGAGIMLLLQKMLGH